MTAMLWLSILDGFSERQLRVMDYWVDGWIVLGLVCTGSVGRLRDDPPMMARKRQDVALPSPSWGFFYLFSSAHKSASSDQCECLLWYIYIYIYTDFQTAAAIHLKPAPPNYPPTLPNHTHTVDVGRTMNWNSCALFPKKNVTLTSTHARTCTHTPIPLQLEAWLCSRDGVVLKSRWSCAAQNSHPSSMLLLLTPGNTRGSSSSCNSAQISQSCHRCCDSLVSCTVLTLVNTVYCFVFYFILRLGIGERGRGRRRGVK